MLRPFYFMALAFLGAEIAASLYKKRSQREQLPPGQAPGLGGQAFPRLPSAGLDSQPPPADPGHRHTAETSQRRLSRACLSD